MKGVSEDRGGKGYVGEAVLAVDLIEVQNVVLLSQLLITLLTPTREHVIPRMIL